MRTSLISLNASNDTLIDNLIVYLGPDVLEENHQYVYTVTAVNTLGQSTSEEKRMSKAAQIKLLVSQAHRRARFVFSYPRGPFCILKLFR